MAGFGGGVVGWGAMADRCPGGLSPYNDIIDSVSVPIARGMLSQVGGLEARVIPVGRCGGQE